MAVPRTRGVPRRLAKSVRLALLLLTLSALLAPAVSASLDVSPGQTAEVVNTGGDPINLRAKPRTSGSILASHGEGTMADVLEGPIWDDAGIAWYKVSIDGTRGYMAAEFLGLPGGEPGDDGGRLDPVVGSASIVNTGGDPINCRAGKGANYSIVTTFAEGDAVELTGAASGSWQPVRCGGTGGFIHVDYVGTGGGAVSADDDGVSGSATNSVRITNTGGDPINLRSKPRTSASILDAFREGTRVDVLEGPIVDDAGISWYKINVSGTRGYMAAEFLGLPSGSTGGSTGGGSGGGSSGGSTAVTGQGTISGTNGDGVRCRSKASTSGSIITVLGEGRTVDLRGAASGGWQPVRCAGKSGYVSAEFVSLSGTPDPDPEPGDGDGGFAAGTTLMVSATNGDGVRLRTRASSNASIVTVIAEGQNVEVRRGSTGSWIAVRHAAGDGFVHQDFLEIADTGSNPPPRTSLDAGDSGLVTDTINFRASASFNADVIAVAKENTVVKVVGGPSNGFYKVEWSGQTGYMHQDYLMWTDQEPTVGDGGVGGPGQPGDGPADGGSGTSMGRKMVSYAERYLGYPYVWATHGPSTFDCSGFTYWVTLKTAKVDIGAGTWTQSVAGRPVAFGSLEPGDLVFFQNTYTWGLSHVGLYIGGGEFIHAQNEETGVVISRLDSPYYKTRWFGARRVI